MLLLRPPSTRPDDVAISLRAPSGCQRTAVEVAAFAVESRCPPVIAERVRTCILHSGRYDCRVTAAAAFFLATRADLARIGGTVMLTELQAPAHP